MPGRVAATLTRIVSSYREATAKRSGFRSVVCMLDVWSAAGRTRSGGDAPLASSLSHAAAHARTGVEIPAKLIAPSPRRVSNLVANLRGQSTTQRLLRQSSAAQKKTADEPENNNVRSSAETVLNMRWISRWAAERTPSLPRSPSSIASAPCPPLRAL